MAHRLAFGPNQRVPLAVRINHSGVANLVPYHDDYSDFSASANRTVPTELDLLALDATPLDHEFPTDDSISFQMTFTDTLGRQVQIDALDVAPGDDANQYFGGVATNLFYCDTTDPKHPNWKHQPLAAWMQCNIRVNDALTDAGILAVVSLTGEQASDSLAHVLQLHMTSTPLQAAEELGMTGWTFLWPDVEYHQAPVMSVRVERGDTMAKIAKELSVDYQSLLQANQPTEDDHVLMPGDLIRVPMFTRASSRALRKEHPAVALTWKEIVKGWTTLHHN